MGTKEDTAKFNKLEASIEKMAVKLANCRGNDQKIDHDILIKEHARITALDRRETEWKADHKELHQETRAMYVEVHSNMEKVHDEMKNDIDKNESTIQEVSGNLNQSMMYIKNLQNGAKVKVGFQTAIIASVLATIIASIIIYFASNIFHNFERSGEDANNQTVLVEIVKQLKENSAHMERVELKLEQPTVIQIEERGSKK